MWELYYYIKLSCFSNKHGTRLFYYPILFQRISNTSNINNPCIIHDASKFISKGLLVVGYKKISILK
jgi:hypothetical protein